MVTNEEADASTARDRTSLGWFTLGVVIGGAIVAVLMLLLRPTSKSTSEVALIRDAIRQEISAAHLEESARQGALQALSQLPETSKPQNRQATDSTASQDITVPPGANVIGDQNAPVMVIEYSDFQCPFCGRFHSNVYPTLLDTYIKTGKVKLIYKHFAFLGQESIWAAQASECAADQEKFWEFHDLMFARQNGENLGAFTKPNLIKMAEELKLDTTTFADCLNSDKTLDRVTHDSNEGRSIGVQGTPHFVINGRNLIGAQPLEEFQKAIELALAAR